MNGRISQYDDEKQQKTLKTNSHFMLLNLRSDYSQSDAIYVFFIFLDVSEMPTNQIAVNSWVIHSRIECKWHMHKHIFSILTSNNNKMRNIKMQWFSVFEWYGKSAMTGNMLTKIKINSRIVHTSFMCTFIRETKTDNIYQFRNLMITSFSWILAFTFWLFSIFTNFCL